MLLRIAMGLCGSLGLLAASILPAQADASTESSDALAARVDSAIAAYEAVRGGKTEDRRRQLVWLGEIDHPRVLEFLQGELQAAAATPFAAVVVEAIGRVPRPELEADLTALLQREQAPAKVRTAAAAAILGLGDRATDRMIALASDDAVALPARLAVVEAVASSGQARGQRALVPLLLRADNPTRVQILRRMAGLQGVPPVANARIKLIRDGDLLVAAIAWRQLVAERHEKARALTVDVLERIVDVPPPQVAAELIGGLASLRDPDFYPALLRFGVVVGAEVRKALRDAAAAAAEDPALLRWLISEGLARDEPMAREASKLLLSQAPAEAVQPLVERVRAELRKNRKKALDTAAGLHELLAKDPTWAQDCANLAAARELDCRLIGLTMLFELGSPAGVPFAQKYLDHRAWELRSLCLRYLARCRDPLSIPHLIARYGKEEGRLAQELDQALFVHTGVRCWSQKEWQDWWRQNGTGFVLPHLETVKGGAAKGGGQTASYYDIPLVSSRVAFLVDHSGSMNAKIGTGQRTRLEVAKEQLRRAAEALPASTMVNLIAYETAVRPLWKEVQRLDKEHRERFLKAVDQLQLAGGTNIHGALEAAFADPAIDTIYLMTDGQPSVGVTDVDVIVGEVLRWNRLRQVVIHGISIGLDSALLQRLAAGTGGEYRYIR